MNYNYKNGRLAKVGDAVVGTVAQGAVFISGVISSLITGPVVKTHEVINAGHPSTSEVKLYDIDAEDFVHAEDAMKAVYKGLNPALAAAAPSPAPEAEAVPAVAVAAQQEQPAAE